MGQRETPRPQFLSRHLGLRYRMAAAWCFHCLITPPRRGPITERENRMLTNRREIHIEWGDCDPAGIVYFPRYFEYGDACTSALFERAGFPKPKLLETYGLAGIPLVDARARFLAPSRFGDMIAVESRIMEWGRSSFTVEHKMFRADALAVEIIEKRVWTVRPPGAPGTLRSQPVPEEVKARFSAAANPPPKLS